MSKSPSQLLWVCPSDTPYSFNSQRKYDAELNRMVPKTIRDRLTGFELPVDTQHGTYRFIAGSWYTKDGVNYEKNLRIQDPHGSVIFHRNFIVNDPNGLRNFKYVNHKDHAHAVVLNKKLDDFIPAFSAFIDNTFVRFCKNDWKPKEGVLFDAHYCHKCSKPIKSNLNG